MYEVIFTKLAAKQLKKIPKEDQQRISKKIQDLAADPRPSGAKALQGRLASYHRVRCGKYRVIYSVEDRKLILLIMKIGHRKDIYEI